MAGKHRHVPDYTINRRQWAGLAEQALGALTQPDERHEDLGRLAAAVSHGIWTWPVAYPFGLAAQAFTTTLHAWCRNRDPVMRAALASGLGDMARAVQALVADAGDAGPSARQRAALGEGREEVLLAARRRGLLDRRNRVTEAGRRALAPLSADFLFTFVWSPS